MTTTGDRVTAQLKFTVGSLFSGIGGLDLAAHWAGFTTSWFVEREPFCQKVLAKHWPGVPCHSDVFECHDLSHVDVIAGGFPCQPFSVAGNRKGADDERYLLPEMLRIIREVKPYAVLFENVPGFPSLNDGAEFKYLLRTLAEMGFDAEWGHLRASDSGAPHQRERWFCVAYAEHDGHATASLKRGNGTAIRYNAQGQDSAREPAGIGSQGTLADADNTERETRRAIGTGAGKQTQSFTRYSQLGHASGARLQGRTPARNARSRRAHGKQFTPRPGAGASRGSTESRLRGTPDGLPSWLDFPGWPARPGEDQHTYEPSRVTTAKTPDRAARLKALGNAVVPQVAYPLFVAIHEWLAENKEAHS